MSGLQCFCFGVAFAVAVIAPSVAGAVRRKDRAHKLETGSDPARVIVDTLKRAGWPHDDGRK